jgi:hypothetical protein
VILNSIVSLAIVLAPIEFFVLVNVARLRGFLFSLVAGFQDPEAQKTLIRNLGNGIGGGILERLGAAKGGATRQAQAALAEGISENVDLGAMEGLSQLVPRKYQKQLQLLIGGYQMFQQMKGGSSPVAGLLGGQQAQPSQGLP